MAGYGESGKSIHGHAIVEYRWTVLKSVYQQTLALCGRFEMAPYCTIPPFKLNIVVLGPSERVQCPQMVISSHRHDDA